MSNQPSTAAPPMGHDDASDAHAVIPPDDTESPRHWRTAQITRLFLTDVTMIVVAVGIAYAVRFGSSLDNHQVQTFTLISVGLGAAWVLALATNSAYQVRTLGVGAEEFKQVARASLQVFALVAITSYVFKLEIGRGFIGLAMPIGLFLLMGNRYLARRALRRERLNGRLSHRVLLVGNAASVVPTAQQLRGSPYAGFVVVGACVPDATLEDQTIPVLGSLHGIAETARRHDVDTIVVGVAREMTASAVRALSWDIEGKGIDLVVAPAVTDVAGPRISMHPVAGLPLIYVDEPQFTGMRRVFKEFLDLSLSLLGVALLAVPGAVIALLIKLDSPGPVLFRQQRVGLGGHKFQVFKFRTMHVDAEARLAELGHLNESSGLLFKITDDPRITRVGRILRRFSLDEFPQLLNVVLGQMSLVGPRPLAVNDDAFVGHERRRLLVKPGITGLWQVSGRTEQSWEDAVRLDLYYVENWSPVLDLVTLVRTFWVLVKPTGV